MGLISRVSSRTYRLNMNSTTLVLRCYNNACSSPDKSFNPDTNTNTSCQYHPGKPTFHDALQGWSCCKKRVTSFQDFLELQGCTLGFHSNVKPEKIEFQKSAREQAASELAKERKNNNNKFDDKGLPKYIQAPPTVNEMNKLAEKRPDINDEKIDLKIQIAPNLAKSVEKFKKLNPNLNAGKIDINNIPVGTICTRNGCKMSFPNDSRCCYHPGVTVFHEGCKYWSCCQKITSDFDSFMNQPGCSFEDEHLWISEKKNAPKIRLEIFQVTNKLTVNIFCKATLSESVKCKVNAVSLQISGKFEAGMASFDYGTEFFGTIDPLSSLNKVKITATKIEITLMKSDLIVWASLWPEGKPVYIKGIYQDADDNKTENKIINEINKAKISDFEKKSDSSDL